MKHRILILLVAALASSLLVAHTAIGAEPIKLGAIFPLADITGDCSRCDEKGSGGN